MHFYKRCPLCAKFYAFDSYDDLCKECEFIAPHPTVSTPKNSIADEVLQWLGVTDGAKYACDEYKDFQWLDIGVHSFVKDRRSMLWSATQGREVKLDHLLRLPLTEIPWTAGGYSLKKAYENHGHIVRYPNLPPVIVKIRDSGRTRRAVTLLEFLF